MELASHFIWRMYLHVSCIKGRLQYISCIFVAFMGYSTVCCDVNVVTCAVLLKYGSIGVSFHCTNYQEQMAVDVATSW
jgi:hypothetical protein